MNNNISFLIYECKIHTTSLNSRNEQQKKKLQKNYEDNSNCTFATHDLYIMKLLVVVGLEPTSMTLILCHALTSLSYTT